MNVDYLAISELLRLHDNDGLNLFGASDDKYEPEVERIVPSLEKLSREEASVRAIVDIFAAVWAQLQRQSASCSICQSQMQKRIQPQLG